MRLQEIFDAATLKYKVAVIKILDSFCKIYDKVYEVNTPGSNDFISKYLNQISEFVLGHNLLPYNRNFKVILMVEKRFKKTMSNIQNLFFVFLEIFAYLKSSCFIYHYLQKHSLRRIL